MGFGHERFGGGGVCAIGGFYFSRSFLLLLHKLKNSH